MYEIEDHVMVALLPIFSDGMQVDYPHLTLVYAGKASTQTTQSLDGLAKAAASLAMLCRPITLRTLTKDVFGEGTEENPRVDVFRFHPNLDLLKMRTVVEDWNASQFPFNPHITVGDEGSWVGEVPRMIAFDKVSFAVGKNYQEFQLSRTMGGVGTDV